jgi:hypothetical protein
MMMTPQELEQRVKSAVAGAGIAWAGLDTHEQARLVEVANELLRKPLRELEQVRKALGQAAELTSCLQRDLYATQEAKERYKASTQALLGQLSEASILSSEMMAIMQSPKFESQAPAFSWWMPLRKAVTGWLEKTQRVVGVSPVRGG